MYEFLLAAHNIIRWIALILLIFAVITAFIGWFRKRKWTQMDRKVGTYTTISIDIQLLLGLLLYIVFSDFGLQAIINNGFSFVMENAIYRQYAIEHALLMLLAVVAAHLGSILPKKVEDSTAKFRRAAIWFTIALVLVLAGIPWDRMLPSFLSFN